MLWVVGEHHHHSSPASLSRSIGVVTLSAFGANGGCVLVFGLLANLAARQVIAALVGTVVVHGIILLGLFYKRDDFRATETGRHLERVNFANVLTILRISAVPTLLFFVVHGRQRVFAWASIVLASIVFLTDLFDGFISRHAHQRTVIGVYLDSAGDYAILVASAIALRVYGLIPSWFFLIVIGRLGLQVLFVVLEVAVIGSARRGTNLIGKASVFAMMTSFALALANTAWELRAMEQAGRYAEYVTGAVLAVSALDKVRLFFTRLLEHRRHRYYPD
jgi:phosphatidylglycerophosphate synthase